MDEKCYITYDTLHSTFCITGDDALKVKKALIRVRATFYQILAREARADALYLVEPLTRNSLEEQIRLVPYGSPKSSNPLDPTEQFSKVRVHLHDAPEIAKLTLSTAQLATQKDMAKARSHILRTLKQMKYYRGMLRLRVRLGTFLLTRYKEGEYHSLTDFMSMMNNPQFAGEVTEE
jgi:hypothetical protein